MKRKVTFQPIEVLLPDTEDSLSHHEHTHNHFNHKKPNTQRSKNSMEFLAALDQSIPP